MELLFASMVSMRKILFTLLISSVWMNVASAQPYPYEATYDDYYGTSDGRGYERSDEYYRERSRTRIARERAKVVHEEESANRDRIYTRIYTSDAERQEQGNSLDTLTQAADAVARVAGTVQYIQNLFGN